MVDGYDDGRRDSRRLVVQLHGTEIHLDRAAVIALLMNLAEQNLLGQIDHVSSISEGSLFTSMVFKEAEPPRGGSHACRASTTLADRPS